jgi:hypothetical protein
MFFMGSPCPSIKEYSPGSFIKFSCYIFLVFFNVEHFFCIFLLVYDIDDFEE